MNHDLKSWIGREDYAREVVENGPLPPTKDHLTLLRAALWSWNEAEFGAASMNPKHPYGNSDVDGDLAVLLPHSSKLDRRRVHCELSAVLAWLAANAEAVATVPLPTHRRRTMGERTTPDSAVVGDRVRTSEGEGVVVASRSAGRNFIDVKLDDGRTFHMFFNYEIISRAAPVVDSELRDQIAVALAKHPLLGNGWSNDPQSYISAGVVTVVLAVVAPELRSAYFNGYDSGFAAANVDDPWAEQQQSADGDLQVLTGVIEQELELAHSGEGYEPKAVAEQIVKDRVAPVLAAKEREVEQIRIRVAQALNLSHSRTLDQLVDDVSQLADGFVRMARENARMRAELAEANSELRARAPIFEAAADTSAELVRVSAELDALRQDAQAWQGHECEAGCTRRHLPPDGSPFGPVTEASEQAEPVWKIEVEIPMRIINDVNHSALFAAVTEAAHGWEPAERDGWDVNVSSGIWALPDGDVTAIEGVDAPATPTEPRVWREGDPQPEGVWKVRDKHGDVWTRNVADSWESKDTMPCGWSYVAKKWAPLTEVVGDQAGGSA